MNENGSQLSAPAIRVSDRQAGRMPPYGRLRQLETSNNSDMTGSVEPGSKQCVLKAKVEAFCNRGAKS
jgi:hypothetical protein